MSLFNKMFRRNLALRDGLDLNIPIVESSGRAYIKTLALQTVINFLARSFSQSTFKIMFTHLLPNMLGIIIVQVMFAIPSAIFFEAFLSFIGIGIPAPDASLGTLISDGYKTFRFLPHLMWYPAAMISFLMLSFNLLADGLRDAFDPKMKE